MTFSWPQFVIPQPLGGTRTWTASFDSYDQYREYCYYCVRLFDGTQLVGDIMAQVDTGWLPDSWTGPGLMDQLYDKVAGVAASGVTNTEWAGVFGRAPDDPFTRLATHPFDAVKTTETSSDNSRWLLRHACVPLHDIWQYDLIDRWTKRVVQSWTSWSNTVRAVRWDGDTLVVTNANGTEERLAPA